jgi:hypothetical protein
MTPHSRSVGTYLGDVLILVGLMEPNTILNSSPSLTYASKFWNIFKIEDLYIFKKPSSN